MPGMMASKRNRIRNGVDNPYDDDGFWVFRGFRGNRKGGKATGGRGWRRAIRKRENTRFKREVKNDLV